MRFDVRSSSLSGEWCRRSHDNRDAGCVTLCHRPAGISRETAAFCVGTLVAFGAACDAPGLRSFLVPGWLCSWAATKAPTTSAPKWRAPVQSRSRRARRARARPRQAIPFATTERGSASTTIRCRAAAATASPQRRTRAGRSNVRAALVPLPIAIASTGYVPVSEPTRATTLARSNQRTPRPTRRATALSIDAATIRELRLDALMGLAFAFAPRAHRAEEIRPTLNERAGSVAPSGFREEIRLKTFD